MERVGRFLWLPWLKGEVLCLRQAADGSWAYWEGEHDGYRRLPSPVRLRRGILRLGDDTWLILDRLESEREHSYRLHWLLPDLSHSWDAKAGHLVLHTPPGDYHLWMSALGDCTCTLERAGDCTPRGWQALHYAQLEPALSVDCTARANSALFWTVSGPEVRQVIVEEGLLHVEAAHWRVALSLPASDQEPLIRAVSWDDGARNQLEVV
jgi:hypothetical protein